MNIEKFFEKIVDSKGKIHEEQEFILEEIYKVETIESIAK